MVEKIGKGKRGMIVEKKRKGKNVIIKKIEN